MGIVGNFTYKTYRNSYYTIYNYIDILLYYNHILIIALELHYLLITTLLDRVKNARNITVTARNISN